MPHPYRTLTSPHNDTLKHLARLVQFARDRRKDDVIVLEGIHLLEAALEQGIVPAQCFINEAALGRAEVSALLARLPQTLSPLVVPEALLGKLTSLSSAPELIAVCPRPHPPRRSGSCLLLEDIQDPGNMGTILRSAAASGVMEVFLSKGCADVFSPKVLRAGMGAHFVLNLHEAADLAEVLAGFAGHKLVTHLEGSQSLYAQNLRGDVAFVFGNEGAGVSAELLQLADCRVRIPMPGHAESLNVAMAATICLFERVRQLDASAG
ncbi:tRNA/rRNA methyltransferase SpoU [Pseudogulbenkiania sp. NH8B]|uniref:TrmH family RNA methyltransferase n=1 Tax=Pseudogulbenkiania sp. (strain NH8B) TaxID=748280 RepID=UPI0002279E06|nr:RNA methyltransferase [Pseudogulbenkiania sp. NH8B]BAK77115.1 tRNA/rRNA methyltransferase SpoU [Pseudogulbenkiania sp. NH8B]